MGDADYKRRRYCLICHVFKPDRTHHCSVCNRCVLNMDHHCPWINNCVGFYNRKIFLLILLYGCINLYMMVGVMIPVAYSYIYEMFNTPYNITGKIYVQIGVSFFIFGLSAVITRFSKFHFQLVMENATTIEKFDKEIEEGVYDLGAVNNVEQMFGKYRSLWLIPYYGSKGLPYGNGVLWKLPTDENINTPNKEPENISKTPKQVLQSNRALFLLRDVQPVPKSLLLQTDIETDSSALMHNTSECAV